MLKVRGLLSAAALLTVALALPASSEVVDLGHVVQASGNPIEQTTVVVKRLSDGQTWISNDERAQQRFSPASTSKIPHTLIAFEKGLATPIQCSIGMALPEVSGLGIKTKRSLRRFRTQRFGFIRKSLGPPVQTQCPQD